MSVSEVESIDVRAADDGSPDIPAPASDYHTQKEVYEKYLPIVRRIAMRTVRSLPPSVTIDDVISAGWLGMVEALGRRTPDMTDDHFEAFASYRVRGAILDHLRMLDPMSRKLRDAPRSSSAGWGAPPSRRRSLPSWACRSATTTSCSPRSARRAMLGSS